MSGDPEKRFRNVMDKLYHSPKPKRQPSLSGDAIGSLARGRRAEPRAVGALERRSRLPAAAATPPLGPTPTCRPWDREDLMRRLATFKAMTWFGRPKVIGPLNCARRGWINVEMDVITCEACGARLLFSTPSSWSLQQVEKAAAVFSLKLDNGHKMLCPWIDNICEEPLAMFPPTPPEALVEGYKERYSELLRLTALPVISSLTIDYMKYSRFNHFMSQSSVPSLTLNNGIKLVEDSRSKDLEGAPEVVRANTYYQALKIISLCGWEPRLLPYVVDRGDKSSLLLTGAHSTGSSARKPGQEKENIIVYSSSPSASQAVDFVDPLIDGYQYDPASVVLDCRFCRACVGLWAFPTTERPLEMFRLVVDPSGQNESTACGSDLVSGLDAPSMKNLHSGNQCPNKGTDDTGTDGLTACKRPMGLHLTIAGGPPPTKQNFRPRVSFPVISRYLRAEFGSITGAGNTSASTSVHRNHVNQYSSQKDDHSEHPKGTNTDPVQLKGLGSLKRKRSEDVEETSDCVNNEEKHAVVISEGSGDVLEIHSSRESSDTHKSVDVSKSSEEADKDAENIFNNGEIPCPPSKDDVTVSETCRNEPEPRLADAPKPHDDNSSGLDWLHHHDSSHGASYLDTNATSCSSFNVESKNCSKGSDLQNLENDQVNNQKTCVLKDKALLPVDSIQKTNDPDHESGSNLKLAVHGQIGEFDPIKHHRPFCPWIAPEDGKNLPGWKLTLSALIQQERDCAQPSELEGPSTSPEEVDDPIISVRRLFMSPPTKKLKGNHNHI